MGLLISYGIVYKKGDRDETSGWENGEACEWERRGQKGDVRKRNMKGGRNKHVE